MAVTKFRFPNTFDPSTHTSNMNTPLNYLIRNKEGQAEAEQCQAQDKLDHGCSNSTMDAFA